MTETELLQVLARGEDSRHQFKRDETNVDGVAAELAALANNGGGLLILGAVFQPPTSATVTPPVTPEVTPEVGRLLVVLKGEMNRAQLMAALGLRDEKHFRQQYQQAAVACGLIDMTLPDKPNSRLQRYRLTPAGQALQQALNTAHGAS